VTNLILAGLLGLSTWLVFDALFVPSRTTRLVWDMEDLGAGGKPTRRQRLRMLEGQPLLDRALGPLLQEWAGYLATWLRRVETDEQKLIHADWPAPFHTLSDFYAWKLVSALVLAGTALLVAGVLAVVGSSQFATLALIAALGLGALGFFAPDMTLDSELEKRQELILTEMAFSLDRMAIIAAAGNTLPVAIRKVALAGGGPFARELQRVIATYDVEGSLAPGLEEMVQRTGMQEVATFAARVRLVQEQGGSIVPALRQMGASTREKLNLLLEERGERNALAMIVPISALVLPAAVIVIAAPAVVSLLEAL